MSAAAFVCSPSNNFQMSLINADAENEWKKLEGEKFGTPSEMIHN